MPLVQVKVIGARDILGRWERATLEVTAAMATEAEELAHQVVDAFKEAAPYNEERDDPHFRDSLDADVRPTVGGFSLEIRTDMPDVRRYMQEGTGIHGPTGARIVPHGSVLAFRWPSVSNRADGMVFFRSVAGMEPIEWEDAAREHARPLIVAFGHKIGQRVAHVVAHGD